MNQANTIYQQTVQEYANGSHHWSQKSQVYTSSNSERLLFKIAQWNKRLVLLSIIGLVGAAFNHFFLLNLEQQLHQSYQVFDESIQTKQELESALSKKEFLHSIKL